MAGWIWVFSMAVGVFVLGCTECPAPGCVAGCPSGSVCVEVHVGGEACPAYECILSAGEIPPSPSLDARAMASDGAAGADAARPVESDAVRPSVDAEAHEAGGALPMDAARTLDGGMDATASADATPPADATPSMDSGDAAPDRGVVMDEGIDIGRLDAVFAPDGAPPAPTFRETVAAILEARGIPRISTRFDEAEIRDQAAMFGGMITFAQALDEAVRSYLEDGRDQESPVALLEFAEGPPCDQARPTDRVRCFLDDPSSQLGLVGAEGFPPENGESIAENWVITVDIPRLSDHLHWAIIDRTGAVAVYNYGFN